MLRKPYSVRLSSFFEWFSVVPVAWSGGPFGHQRATEGPPKQGTKNDRATVRKRRPPAEGTARRASPDGPVRYHTAGLDGTEWCLAWATRQEQCRGISDGPRGFTPPWSENFQLPRRDNDQGGSADHFTIDDPFWSLRGGAHLVASRARTVYPLQACCVSGPTPGHLARVDALSCCAARECRWSAYRNTIL